MDFRQLLPIDVATHAVGNPITLNAGFGGRGESPSRPDGTAAYVPAERSGRPRSTWRRTSTTAQISVGADLRGIAITPDGARAYVVDDLKDTVSAISLASNTVVQTIPLPAGSERRSTIAITPDGTKAFVTDQGSGEVTPIELPSGTVERGDPRRRCGLWASRSGASRSRRMGRRRTSRSPAGGAARIDVIDTATDSRHRHDPVYVRPAVHRDRDAVSERGRRRSRSRRPAARRGARASPSCRSPTRSRSTTREQSPPRACGSSTPRRTARSRLPAARTFRPGFGSTSTPSRGRSARSRPAASVTLELAGTAVIEPGPNDLDNTATVTAVNAPTASADDDTSVTGPG